MNLKVIALDADDTLWVNEPYFEEVEKKFCALMGDYLSRQGLSQALFTTQVNNLPLYGYGIKGYILSMIETAIKVSNGTISVDYIEKITQFGRELINKPIELIDGVEETLKQLQGNYKLVVATKGDLKDQQRKLHNSGLGNYFHHIEVMADKELINYEKLLKRLEVSPDEFMMIGNSLKSDVLPVLEMGGKAIHIPFYLTWEHEKISHKVVHENFKSFEKIIDILPLLLE
ncbi:MAG: HAD family hydrolase [Flavobacterium sp.]